jgi:hypothetical protein
MTHVEFVEQLKRELPATSRQVIGRGITGSGKP